MTDPAQPAQAEVVGGPVRVKAVTSGLIDAFADLWLRVSRAGGAVDFTPDVDPAEVRAAAMFAAAEASDPRSTMLVVWRGTDLVGVAFLERGARRMTEHSGRVVRLMVDPDLQGRGWGARLLDACVEQAREQGIERLFLSARDGTGLPEYYRRRGWREVGRLPRAIRVAPGDERDEVWFHREIQPG
ncbi:GNAT family N-acetyltransferase [Gandjariella thermophila]|uniref:N-acetyltransferase n=1 Tax=Gandjariella thermophila TaxID=1931992 RepID=A0A4D4JC38_9PSEU|nr:GNAT family N-acetyltransferase [Gandjariella thermophila]GDY31477.1 N-acetyltransferase [Gandjariella thermophila]